MPGFLAVIFMCNFFWCMNFYLLLPALFSMLPLRILFALLFHIMDCAESFIQSKGRINKTRSVRDRLGTGRIVGVK